MKITYFRMKGYVNILQGMGLDELIIPFDQFKNRIILIQGANGTGKSTILKALSPEPDSTDSFRTDVMVTPSGVQQIVEYPGEKEIHYEDNAGNKYIVLIKSIVDGTKTRRSTQAFISKNGEEYNPNGTVSGFREARDNLFGIDSVYLDMSTITSENRGLVDMAPGERRKYLAAYIGSLDTYNKIYKNINKQVSFYKAKITDLNNRIYRIGDEAVLRARLASQENLLKTLNDQRDTLLKDLSEAETTIAIIDPDNKIQDLYSSISDQLHDINDQMKGNDNKLEYLHSYLQINPEDAINIDQEINDTDECIKSYKDKLSEYSNKVSSLISVNEAELSSVEKDKAMLRSITSDEDKSNLEDTVKHLQSNLDMLESDISDQTINILKNVGEERLRSFNNDIQSFRDFIINILYDNDATTIDRISSIALGFNKVSEKELQLQLSDYSRRLEDEERKANIIRDNLDRLKDLANKRPAECKIDNCPYIAETLKLAGDNTEEDYESHMYKVEEYSAEVDRLIEEISSYQTVSKWADDLSSYVGKIHHYDDIIRMISDIDFLLDNESLKYKIDSHSSFDEFRSIENILSQYQSYKACQDISAQISSLESDLKVYRANKELIDSLNSSISSSEAKYEERKRDIQKYSNECTSLSGIIEKMEDRLFSLKALKDALDLKNNLAEKKERLREEYEKIKDNIKTVKAKVDSLNTIKNDLQNTENSIAPISDDINQLRLGLTNLVDYQNQYKETSDQFEKVTFIRDACSPGNGKSIQSQYVKMYMNEIISVCNMLLGYMFNGTIKLGMPIIDDKQFMVPFIGPGGMEVPDISMGSTAQKCMIGLAFSCAAMIKSSNSYNIPRFDEIDGGLDQLNRSTFIEALNQVLDILKADQCIMVSHNAEFETQSTTLIECTHTGIKVGQ